MSSAISLIQGNGHAPMSLLPGWRRRKFLSFFGPGVLVAVGYMDPGNWATSLAGGSKYGYTLLSVIVAANLMAMLFQAAAVRLGIASGWNLAEACRQHFSPRVNVALWIFCEVAIVACNLAEVIGMAIGLNLLFGLPLLAGVVVTFCDVMLILMLQSRGFRWLEAAVMVLVATIGICFAFLVRWLHPSMHAVVAGLVPRGEIVVNPDMLYLAVGIVGATVMPHNLYLHSAIVQNRRHEPTPSAKRQAIRYATLDSNVALAFAVCVNAAILIVAAGAFHRAGAAPVLELSDAYTLLSPLIGVGIASAVFGVALLCAGLSSSVTGTLAGQIVMEGFLHLRIPAAARALITRCVAIVPAIVVISYYGTSSVNSLLVLSQVVLSLQLPFAIVPLLWFTTRRRCLGDLAFTRVTGALLWLCATAIIVVNAWLLTRLI